MHGKWFAAAAVTTAAMLMFALPVHARDTYRLSLPSKSKEAPTLSLVENGKGADTVSVRGRGGSYRGGSYRGGYRGYSRGFYGGYRGYSRGFYGGHGYYGRRYYGFGYYPSYYYGPSFALYQPYYYTTPSVIYTVPSYSVDPCLLSSAAASSRVLSVTVSGPAAKQNQVAELLAAPSEGDVEEQTFPYDGGPRNPAPMPRAEPTPGVRPSAAPAGDHSASLPAKVASKLVYPAYGEELLHHAPRIQERGILVKGEPLQKLSK